MAEGSSESTPDFFVIPEPEKFVFKDAYVQSSLTKWDLAPSSKVYRFRFSKRYHKLAADEFLVDFFNNETVQKEFKVLNERREWAPIAPVTEVKCEIAPSSIVSMDFFDRLQDSEPQIVKNGSIVKCMDMQYDGFMVSDLLRDMLVNEDSENAAIYSPEERSQLLFRIFYHLALGGPMCQFEDELEPYTETAKRLYKGLVSVQKNASTGKVEITSVVYAVNSVTAESWSLFPKNNKQNFCFVCVDVLRRQCTVWYNAHFPYW